LLEVELKSFARLADVKALRTANELMILDNKSIIVLPLQVNSVNDRIRHLALIYYVFPKLFDLSSFPWVGHHVARHLAKILHDRKDIELDSNIL
jgi:hypothetical protein